MIVKSSTWTMQMRIICVDLTHEQQLRIKHEIDMFKVIGCIFEEIPLYNIFKSTLFISTDLNINRVYFIFKNISLIEKSIWANVMWEIWRNINAVRIIACEEIRSY